MAEVLILITDGNPGTGRLTLEQNVKAQAGDTVIWRVEQRSPPPPPVIQAIINITEKPESDTELFSERPHQVGGNPLEWRAVIDPNLSAPCLVFSYLIEWQPRGSGPTRTHDPIIAIKASQKIFRGLPIGLGGGLLLGGAACAVLWVKNRTHKNRIAKLEDDIRKLKGEQA